VLDVGPAQEVLPRSTGAEILRVRGVVLPGLVNAHAHVELSALRGRVPGGAGFVPWVEQLIRARMAWEPDEDAAAIERAVDELHSFGTRAIGEVTNSLATVGALGRKNIVGCIFHEVFGVEREGVMRRARALLAQIEERLGRWNVPELAYAPAAHTLYTTHEDAVREIIDHARARGRRTSLHLAEHAAERRALEHGDGPVVDWFAKSLKLPRVDWPHESPIAVAARLGALAPHVLLVHLADARPDELESIAAAGAPVVLCPRSNLYIESRLPRLLAMRQAGIDPALGTDSLASNATLDVLAEARALADRFPSVPAEELVRMATWNGARALGRPDLGRLARGARPGLLAVDCDPGADACAALLKGFKKPRRWLTVGDVPSTGVDVRKGHID
jgi:cytosine/adenosine deaminase-related metal-dependent hydrolase